MREPARAGCHDLCMDWEQMPVEDDAWTGADDWDLVADWSSAPDAAPLTTR